MVRWLNGKSHFVFIPDPADANCPELVHNPVYFPSESCTSFTVCMPSGAFLYRCPCNTLFHFVTHQCLPHLSWFYSDPSDCSKYWRCVANAGLVSWHLFSCQSGLGFNIHVPGNSPYCDARENVQECLPQDEALRNNNNTSPGVDIT